MPPKTLEHMGILKYSQRFFQKGIFGYKVAVKFSTEKEKTIRVQVRILGTQFKDDIKAARDLIESTHIDGYSFVPELLPIEKSLFDRLIVMDGM